MLIRLFATVAATTFLFLLPTFIEASPQRCEETKIQYNAVVSNFSITIFADLKISSNDGSITVTNINATAINITNTDVQINLEQICAWGRSGSITVCNNKFTDPITINVGESNVLELQMGISMNNSMYESDESPTFYSGIVDGKDFSFYDGRLFDDNNTCYNYVFQDGNYLVVNLEECCTSMISLNVNTSSNTQTCNHFTSISSIAETNKNPYANIAFDYDISNNNVTMIGKFNGSVEYQPYLIIDDAQGCDEILNGTIYCGYPLSEGGNKLLVFISESFNFTQIYGFAGRIVVRDGLALMDDVTPFTSNNTCQTFNATYDSYRNLGISTTICCTSFQAFNDSNVSPSPTTSVGTTDASSSPSSPTEPSTLSTLLSSSTVSSSIGTTTVAATTTSGSNPISILSPFSMFLATIISFTIFKI